MTPKQRVREIMEVGSGHKWLLDKDEDDSLSYTSKENGTPGLCLFFDGHATLSPETADDQDRLKGKSITVPDFKNLPSNDS